ncbi:MAG: sigma factor-like helix-turn-helix DNA-binding protein [Clostridia bacterium]|jgi:hypothetical protein|nr:helix-turn-helix domain-containing protein [Clostridia bacterium]MDD4275797.1 sigma factor-like helix-turn-helix DNA-binding protein [Clostridia bacterium]
MDKNLKISLLAEFYGNNLTKKQNEIVNKYYDQNQSLKEIAEEFGVTRQAISDLLRRAVNTLNKLETNFKLLERYMLAKDLVESLIQKVQDEKIEKNQLITSIKQILDTIVP